MEPNGGDLKELVAKATQQAKPECFDILKQCLSSSTLPLFSQRNLPLV
jgi:hypothetical protein